MKNKLLQISFFCLFWMKFPFQLVYLNNGYGKMLPLFILFLAYHTKHVNQRPGGYVGGIWRVHRIIDYQFITSSATPPKNCGSHNSQLSKTNPMSHSPFSNLVPQRVEGSEVERTRQSGRQPLTGDCGSIISIWLHGRPSTH